MYVKHSTGTSIAPVRLFDSQSRDRKHTPAVVKKAQEHPQEKVERYLHSLFVLSQQFRRKFTQHLKESKVRRWIILSFLILILEGKLNAIPTVKKQ